MKRQKPKSHLINGRLGTGEAEKEIQARELLNWQFHNLLPIPLQNFLIQKNVFCVFYKKEKRTKETCKDQRTN